MNKYFLVPVAACVATVSLAPVAIHAQTWTQQFDAKQNVKLDYTFTVTFNDVPKAELIKEIVAVQGDKTFKTNVEYVAGAKYVRVTVDSLQYNSSYELQVHLQNGLKYKMDFTTTVDPAAGTEPGTNPGTNPGTTDPETNPGTNPGTTDPETNPGTNPGTTDPETNPGTNPGTTDPETNSGTNPGTTDPETSPETESITDPVAKKFLSDYQHALDSFVASSKYLLLEDTTIYQNAAALVPQYEHAAAKKENTKTIEEQMTSMKSALQQASTKIKAVHTKLEEALAIIEKGPYQKEEMQYAFDEFLASLDIESASWTSPAQITTASIDALISELKVTASTNILTVEMVESMTAVQALLNDYRKYTLFPGNIAKENYYVTGTTLIKQAEALKTSVNEEQIGDMTTALEDFISESEYYISSLDDLKVIQQSAKEAEASLKPWKTLFTTLKSTANTAQINTAILSITTLLKTIETDLQTKSYIDLSTNVWDYDSELSPYTYELEYFIMDLLQAEIDMYDEYYDALLEKHEDDEEYTNTKKFIAFDEALENARMFDATDFATSKTLFEKLQKAYNAAL